MPSPHKRTRSGNSAGLSNDTSDATEGSTSQLEHDEHEHEIPSPTPSAPVPIPRTRRQTQAQATMTPPATNSRPRPSGSGGLARSSSLMFTPTRRTNNSSHGATPFTLSPSTPSLGGTGMLLRTQSTPSSIGMGSPSLLKSPSVSGGSAGRGKGDDDYFSLGPRRPGQGKENIPPKKEDERESGSRKRLRVSSRSGGRGRSGSVSSLRSETPSTSGRPSLGHTSSLSRITSRAPSPTPSTCSNTTRSFDSVSIATSSIDPLDVMSVAGDGDTDTEDMDIHKTPTKPKPTTRAQYSKGLYTPPPSSPTVEDTTKRIQLIRVQSSLSLSSESSEELKSSNPYKYLKSFLRLSTSGDELDKVIVGRASEKETLRAYLGSKEREVGMYVSGPPGTGKTALVTALGRGMAGSGWGVVEIGCMGLKVGDMWKRLGEELGCGKTEAGVVDHIEGLHGDLLIILDEIDSLLPPSGQASPATSHLLSKVFALPLASTPTRSIKLVAISNTLDLTIRARLSLPNTFVPRVLPFKAYGATEMGEIMLSRIASAAINRQDSETVKVDSKAVELLTRKVEATNGDLRNCLGCLTSAVSLAEVEWTKKATVLVKVSLPHTIKAFNSHTQQLKAAAGSGNGAQSATGKKVRSVPLQGKMVLVSILVYLARTRAGLPGNPTTSVGTPTKSSEALNTANLFTTYTTLLSHHTSPFPPSHESDYRDLLSNLEVLGLVKLTSSTASRKYGPKVDLCVRDEELKEGLGVGKEGSVGGLADEEVKRIYEREAIKIQSAISKAERASSALEALGEEL